MFTREDYDKYFDQIARVERKMIYGSYELGRTLDDLPLIRALKRIGDDEVRHYGYVLKMLKVTADPGHSEHRREPREHYLGTIVLKNAQDPSAKPINAYCVNLSSGGICLECAPELPPGGDWELEILLFGKNEPLFRRGEVVWTKEIEPNFHISGMSFDL